MIIISQSGETADTLAALRLAKEKGITLVDITLSVPSEDIAASICDHWQTKNESIYQYLVTELF